jgi:hypothetical protein
MAGWVDYYLGSKPARGLTRQASPVRWRRSAGGVVPAPSRGPNAAGYLPRGPAGVRPHHATAGSTRQDPGRLRRLRQRLTRDMTMAHT